VLPISLHREPPAKPKGKPNKKEGLKGKGTLTPSLGEPLLRGRPLRSKGK